MDIQLLKKYNKPGPRYTSYPPATYFHTEFNQDNYIEQLKKSNNQEPESISLYVHIPFCPRLCHFCGCNTSVSRNKEFIERYINAIIKEIETISTHLDKNRIVTQIHWGGGTPNSISMNYVERVMNIFKNTFVIAKNAEIAMECSPAYLEFKDIHRLAAMGFNRLSLGIQDFNEDVLRIVNRAPAKHPVEKLVAEMKAAGMEGVNIDLIYGLPGQTVESFSKSVKRAIDVQPDRIVTFSYAHVPWVKSAQKHLEKVGLPTPEEKLAMFDTAYNLMAENDYISIGMDHYAKPDDELSKALENRRLHRNFQGYCTKETTGQVYGFGSTSISQLYGAYIQNHKNIEKYIENIEKSGLAVERGYELTNNDLIRREVINEIMCNGFLSFDAVADKFKIHKQKVVELTEYKPEKLDEFKKDNLLTIENNNIKLKPKGFFVVRNIAMEFDPLLKEGKGRYSKTV